MNPDFGMQLLCDVKWFNLSALGAFTHGMGVTPLLVLSLTIGLWVSLTSVPPFYPEILEGGALSIRACLRSQLTADKAIVWAEEVGVTT